MSSIYHPSERDLSPAFLDLVPNSMKVISGDVSSLFPVDTVIRFQLSSPNDFLAKWSNANGPQMAPFALQNGELGSLGSPISLGSSQVTLSPIPGNPRKWNGQVALSHPDVDGPHGTFIAEADPDLDPQPPALG